MTRNNSSARRAQRRQDAQNRALRPVTVCRGCGRRHDPARDCWGPVRPPQPSAWSFRKVLRMARQRLTRWRWGRSAAS